MQHTGTIREGRLSVSSIEKVVDVLNAAYNWAIARGELESNPIAPIKSTLDKRLQKMKQRTSDEADVSVLSEDEEKAFVQEALSRNPKSGEYKYAAGLYGLLIVDGNVHQVVELPGSYYSGKSNSGKSDDK